MRRQITLWARRYWPYTLISLAIMGPLLVPGYVLTMDMVFVPHPPIPGELNASFPFYILLHYLSYLVPGDVLQKVLLLGILIGGGVGMDRMLTQLFPRNLSRWAITAASLFYMTSAFVYERMMMGQWAVVAGYALLPFAMVALLRFLDLSNWRQTFWLVAWTLLLSIMSVHALVPFAVASLILIGMRWRQLPKVAGKLSGGLLIFLTLASYWLIPAIVGSSSTGAALQGSTDTQAFASTGGPFSLLRLQGMWAESFDIFRLPQELTVIPGVWQTIVWMTMTVGFIAIWRHQRRLAVAAGMFIAISCLVALVGIGPMYREPHKVMILAAVGMSILLAVGLNAWLRRIIQAKPSFTAPAGVLVCLLPLLLNAGVLWGFSGQLSARNYPSEWYALNERLGSFPDNKPAIFVPWHLYQRYSFSPRIVANPAATFFEDRRIIVNADPEFADVRPIKEDEVTKSVDHLLKRQPNDIVDRLRELGIGYVIFAKEPGYENYEFLSRNNGLRRIFSQGRLTLYEIKETPWNPS